MAVNPVVRRAVAALALVAGGATLATTAPIPAAAQARIACGGVYEVIPGDTLREIALRAYDDGDYQLIFSANRAVISRPSLLLVGEQLFIPCRDGSGPQTRDEALQLAARPPAESTPQPAARASADTREQSEPAAAPATEPAGAAPREIRSAEIVPRPPRPGDPQRTDSRTAAAEAAARAEEAAASQPEPTATRAEPAPTVPVRTTEILPRPPEVREGNRSQAGAVQVAAARRIGSTEAIPRVPEGRAATQAAGRTATGTTARTTARAAATARNLAPAAVTEREILPVPRAGGTRRTGNGAEGGQAFAALDRGEAQARRTRGAPRSTSAPRSAASPASEGDAAAGADPGADPGAEVSERARVEPAPADPDQAEVATFLLPSATGRLQSAAPSQPDQAPPPVQPLPNFLPSQEYEPEAGLDAEPEPEPTLQTGTELAAAVAADGDYGNTGFTQPPIRLLSGPYPPYSGQDLPALGMLSDVLARALEVAAPERPIAVTFEGDWSAHLATLLPGGAHDLGYPWFRPDCEGSFERLSPAMRARCTDFLWSQPLHEVVTGYFVRAGDPLAGVETYEDLQGTSICRPAGYYTFDLEQRGLGADTVTLVRGDSPRDCLERLLDGRTDVVPLNVALTETVLADLDAFGQVVELTALADILTLHVLAPRTNPFARSYLTLVNQGLRDMRNSGEWFQVIARHLANQM